MATDYNNPLLPGYTRSVKKARAGGYSPLYTAPEAPSMVSPGDGTPFSYSGDLLDKKGSFTPGWRDWVTSIGSNSQFREAYKNHYNSQPKELIGPKDDDDPTPYGSGPTVPGQPMVGLNGDIVYPWEDGYEQLFRNNINQFGGVTEFGDDPNIAPFSFIDNIELNPEQSFQETITYPRNNSKIDNVELNPDKITEKSDVFEQNKIDNIELNPDKIIERSEVSTPNNNSKIDDKIKQSILDVLEGGSFPGTESAVSKKRDALGVFAKDLRAKAGLSTAKSGGIGQGSASGAENAVQKGILGALGQSEQDIAALRSGDYMKALELGIGSTEFEKTLQLQRDQLNETGRQADLRTLQSMAADNPVLQSKLMNSILKDQKMEFTTEELDRLKTYYEEKKSRDEALDKAELEILEALPEVFRKQIKDFLDPSTQDKITDTYKDDLGLSDGEFKLDEIGSWNADTWSSAISDPDAFNVLKENLQTFNDNITKSASYEGFENLGLKADKVDIVGNKEASKKAAGAGKGSIILYNGRPMRITLFNSQRKQGAIRGTGFTTGTERNVVIKGIYLDEQGSEPIEIGGTEGWVDV